MGDWLTQATIWVAMALWCLAMLLPVSGGAAAGWIRFAALLFYLGHILLAYHFYYEWSHQVAWEATARDTDATVGISSGFGLLVNFAFAGILLFDLVCQWRRRERKWGNWIDGLILFLILNGAVVFGGGAVRIYGALLLTGVLFAVGLRARRAKPK